MAGDLSVEEEGDEAGGIEGGDDEELREHAKS